MSFCTVLQHHKDTISISVENVSLKLDCLNYIIYTRIIN